ncbi:thioesterase [Skermanella stibiiresistens SB22]|uniref:Thioesterase n=1 Tax=Skermanella stibiiresistens SB22 TaxID=1385369 RepID=W9H8E2_9PROT|nr:PaaI family thioesterase [Skermanella stibiiresistens]EWY41026.1 thioesterase [Skermanella stibiiresistens SB22]
MINEKPAFDPAAAGWERLPDAGFLDLVGPLWRHRDEAGAVYGFLAEPKHANLINVVQGGMLMTFADRTLGITAWEAADNQVCVTIQFDMQFIGAADIGDFVEIRPEVIRKTRTLVFLRGTILDGDRVVAAASGVWKILDRK